MAIPKPFCMSLCPVASHVPATELFEPIQSLGHAQLFSGKFEQESFENKKQCSHLLVASPGHLIISWTFDIRTWESVTLTSSLSSHTLR